MGFDEALFWASTPRQIVTHFTAAARRRQREHNDRAWHAWTVAALGRVKKMPKLDTLLAKPQTPRRRQTWEEQLAIMQAWSARTNAKSGHQ